MYELRRLCQYVIEQHKTWEKHIIKKANVRFMLTDQQLMFLLNLDHEYDYYLARNVVIVDRHPSLLRDHVPDDFLSDYEKHMCDKFFVLYEYEKVEDV